jgi:hypothetical protein
MIQTSHLEVTVEPRVALTADEQTQAAIAVGRGSCGLPSASGHRAASNGEIRYGVRGAARASAIRVWN